MTKRVAHIAKRLEANRNFRSWKDLPATFLEETAGLSADEAVDLVGRLWELYEHRFLYAASLLVHRRPTALKKMRWKVLEPLGDKMDSWWSVDMFATLAGPAWREGQISDRRVLLWTRSKNRWWRRAALVCTVFLNRKSQGGRGDTPRTLAICEQLVKDRDDMVVKGMSWALRDLIAHDRKAVEGFLEKHDAHLAARVKREVRNKLTTGRKNPPRKKANINR
jgi:3-methyladenine DNA glycosylase AlkD